MVTPQQITVTPAKAGVQFHCILPRSLDSRFRVFRHTGNDENELAGTQQLTREILPALLFIGITD